MIFITLGDPKSVNIEILLKSLVDVNLEDFKVCLVGSIGVFRYQLSKLGITENWNVEIVQSVEQVKSGQLNFFDIEFPLQENEIKDLSSMQCGVIAYKSLQLSAELSNRPSSFENKVAVVTCPINKVNCIKAGMGVSGQTEFFTNAWGGKSIMILGGDKIKVGLATNHIPVTQIRENLSVDLYVDKAKLLYNCMKKVFLIETPRIAIAGFNPHAGEGGEIGNEELEFIKPAIRELSDQGIDVSGPESADTVFYRCLKGEFDAVLASYHDQGLPALKVIEFETAINITYGLKHFRVSPDHGPASDLYLKNIASHESMKRSLSRALEYVYGAI